jgi:hypothetical protein
MISVLIEPLNDFDVVCAKDFRMDKAILEAGIVHLSYLNGSSPYRGNNIMRACKF